MVEQIPIFPSSDFDRTEEFWALLGYGDTVRHGGEYMIMRHPLGFEQHFFSLARINPKKNFHGAYVRFETPGDAAELYQQWSNAAASETFTSLAGNVGRIAELTDTSYGLQEFAMLDPDGSLLRVGAPIG